MSMSNDELHLLATFADEAKQQLHAVGQRLAALERASGPERRALLEDVLREVHSLKGAARAVSLDRVVAVAHRLESLLTVMPSGEVELAVVYQALGAITALVDEALASVDETVRPIRTLALSTVFVVFPRMVRELARELGKEVTLEIEGGEIEVERHVLEQLRSPLIHMVSNCVDHGMEPPGTREAAGKRRDGRVVLRAARRATDLVIEVIDDGPGIDVEELKVGAIERGIISAETAEAMSEREAVSLIFRSGFTTKREVTELSGRGVGLDVVREHVERLHGTIHVESTLGEGSTFTLSVPLGLRSTGRLAA